MATNKAKRSIHLAQPQPQRARRSRNHSSAEIMPVRASVYRALAELNAGLEKVTQDMETLGRVKYLVESSVTSMCHQICRIRAQANREIMSALNDRELANAGYFDTLCDQPPQPPPQAKYSLELR